MIWEPRIRRGSQNSCADEREGRGFEQTRPGPESCCASIGEVRIDAGTDRAGRGGALRGDGGDSMSGVFRLHAERFVSEVDDRAPERWDVPGGMGEDWPVRGDCACGEVSVAGRIPGQGEVNEAVGMARHVGDGLTPFRDSRK